MGLSKVVVDLRARTFSVEVPDEKLESILDRLELLFASAPDAEDVMQDEAEVKPAKNSEKEEASAEQNSKPKKRARTGGGKTKSLSIIDMGLDESQRGLLRTFFSEKSPLGQGTASGGSFC